MSNDISRIAGSGPSESRSHATADNRSRTVRRDGDAAAAQRAAPTDAVTLSADASKIINLEAKLRELPDVDEARVERIRTAVASGEYHIDPRRVAQKFLELDGQL